MLDQTISARSLHRLCSISEVIEYKLGATKDDQLFALEKIAQNINDDGFKFSEFKSFQRNGKLVYKPLKAEDHFAIKRVNQSLKVLLGVKQSDRNTLVNQVKTLLAEKTPFIVTKVDIESFYESIPLSTLISKCWEDPILSYKTKMIIDDLLNSEQFDHKKGLPRGLSISATLSEFYLSEFDKLIKETQGVYYSARYVDDIIVFSIPTDQNIFTTINTQLEEIGLSINSLKSTEFQNKTGLIPIEFDYLGYRFKKNNNDVEIDISPKKVKKIKTRLAKSFYQFSKTSDFSLLIKRVKFLTGNFSLTSRSKVEGNDLKSGIYYNYSEVPQNSDALKELDEFFVKLIYAKNGKLGTRLSTQINNKQRRLLRKYSFRKGFENKISHKFTYDDIVNIRKCWSNE